MGRTLVVTSTFPQWEGDPRGGFIRRFWERRAAQGEHVEVIAPRTRWSDGEIDGPLAVTRIHYAPQRWSTFSGHFGILENVRARPYRAALLAPFLGRMASVLSQRLVAERWDRLVAHMVVPCGILAARAAARTGVPFEVYGHGTDVDMLLQAPAVVRRWLGNPLRNAAAVYVPSDEKRGRLSAVLPELALRCHVATMVETVVDEPVVRRPVPGRILFLGRLIRQKGVDDLIRAVAELPGAAHLHIAGDGPERAKLTRLADRMGVDAVFHGFVQGSRKRDAFASASVVCVPSREIWGLSEGAPLVLREASQLGIPVVATRVGGIPELAVSQPQLFTLVPPGDRSALRSALSRHVAG